MANQQNVGLDAVAIQTMIQGAIETAISGVTSRLDDMAKGTLSTRQTDVSTGQDVSQDEAMRHNAAGLTNRQQVVMGAQELQILAVGAGVVTAVLGHVGQTLQQGWNGSADAQKQKGKERTDK